MDNNDRRQNEAEEFYEDLCAIVKKYSIADKREERLVKAKALFEEIKGRVEEFTKADKRLLSEKLKEIMPSKEEFKSGMESSP